MTETATEITAAGYTDLAIGQRIYDRWMYIEFRDVSGGKITRLPTGGGGTTADTRIAHTIVDKKVTFVCSFSGATLTDSDIAAYMAAEGHNGACTFKYAVLKDGDTDGDTDLMATDDFTTATIADSGDTLTVTVNAGIL